MPVNYDKRQLWQADIAQSVYTYDTWFMQFAPQAYDNQRAITAKDVETALTLTVNLTNITPSVLQHYPAVLRILRYSTAPPIARCFCCQFVLEFLPQHTEMRQKWHHQIYRFGLLIQIHCV